MVISPLMIELSTARPSHSASTLVEHFFRHEYGKTIAHLTRKYGSAKLELIEDSVQEALLKAMKIWSFGEVPKNPSGWIYRVANNHLIDLLRRGQKQEDWEKQDLERDLGKYDALDPQLEGEIKDDQLRMMFACCHPALSLESQVMLTLKLLCGFGNAEISRSLLKSKDAVAKALTRGKKKFKAEVGELSVPMGGELKNRLAVVAKIIYVLFTEGYNATQGEKHIQLELCNEAFRLGGLLLENQRINAPVIQALMALMSFQASRFEARLDAQGQLLTLDQQDRSKWDEDLISKGVRFMVASASADMPSEYHFQAGIAFLHCSAPDFESTEWDKILNLYNGLVLNYPSPIVRLNRVVAFERVHGPEKALKELKQLEESKALQDYYLFYAVKGDLLYKLGRLAERQECLNKAISLTENEVEVAFLRKKLD